MRCVLAHDVGTTGDKATLYDEEGALVRSAFIPYETLCPRAGWLEQNPQDWWRALCQATQVLIRASQVSPAEIAVVSFSGQMMGAVAVDAAANPTRNAIIWADQRAVKEVAAVAERVDPRRVYALTGHRLSPSYSAAKIAWIKECEPRTYAATRAFLNAKDFLAARLTGAFVTDRSDASGTNLYDLEGGTWSGRLVDAFGIDPEKLPAICDSTAAVGEISAEAAADTGLRPGTPVVIGGGDGSCAGVGAGVIREGLAYNYIGSSSWIAVATPRPILDPEMRTFTWAHVVPGMFSPCGTMQAAGGSYQFARDLLAESEKAVAENLGTSAYELMNQELVRSPPGARGLLFLPYLLGERSPRWNPDARAAFIGLTNRHRRPDLLRAVLEGVTLNLRIILEAFRRQGAAIESLRVIGGGARSAAWNQIMADVFGIPVNRLSLIDEATSMGAAAAGGVGVGIWKDFSKVDEMVQIANEAKPRAELRALYDELSSIFEEAYAALEGASLFRRLAAVDTT
ncbi:MAG TPA: xylulokinase [Gaiellaceae bacterium]|nr:xylulokinase [Gaiellaceae bacterium]